MNYSELFRLNLKDVAKGLVSAVLGAVCVSVIGVLQSVLAPGVDVLSIDFAELGKQLLNTAILAAQASFFGYISKNFLSDSQGRFLGRV